MSACVVLHASSDLSWVSVIRLVPKTTSPGVFLPDYLQHPPDHVPNSGL